MAVTAGAATGNIDFALTPLKRVAAPNDFDGDGTSDMAVFRPSDGGWYVLRSSSGFTTSSLDRFGLPGDIPVPGDYNGDGTIDRAVFEPSTATWFVQNQFTIQFGLPGDIPVPGDYNGDGTTDLAVYRPSTGAWSVRNQFTVQLGRARRHSRTRPTTTGTGFRRSPCIDRRPARGTSGTALPVHMGPPRGHPCAGRLRSGTR